MRQDLPTRLSWGSGSRKALSAQPNFPPFGRVMKRQVNRCEEILSGVKFHSVRRRVLRSSAALPVGKIHSGRYADRSQTIEVMTFERYHNEKSMSKKSVLSAPRCHRPQVAPLKFGEFPFQKHVHGVRPVFHRSNNGPGDQPA